jgi:hypothetical protein
VSRTPKRTSSTPRSSTTRTRRRESSMTKDFETTKSPVTRVGCHASGPDSQARARATT